MNRIFTLFFCLFLLGICKRSTAQNAGTPADSATIVQVLRSYKLNRFYHGTLSEVLKELQKETGILFEGNQKLLSSTSIEDRPFNLSLEDVLTRWCKRLQLKWYLHGQDKVIYIIRKTDSPGMFLFGNPTIRGS